MKYEDIVQNPTQNLNFIFKFLSLDPTETHEHIDSCFLSSSFVDPNAIKYLKPTRHFLETWLDQISTIQKKKIFLFYINFLKNLDIIIDNYDINQLSDLLIKKRVKYIPYIMRTNNFLKIVSNFLINISAFS